MMSFSYQNITFYLARNPLWGAEYFPEEYLHTQRSELLAEAEAVLHPFGGLHLFCDRTQNALGFVYEDCSLIIDYMEASSIFLEILKPAKGAGGVFITIQFSANIMQPSFLLLSLEYDVNFSTLYMNIAESISLFTSLPIKELDLGYDV